MNQESKIDKIQEDVTEIKVTLAEMAVTLKVNTADLEKHMSRTEAAEKRLNILEGAWYALCALGALIVGLSSLGVFSNLF